MRRSDDDLIDRFGEYLRWEVGDEVTLLVQSYPERRSLTLDWTDLARWDPDLAEDLLDKPESMREYAEEALRLVPLPVDVSMGQATVRFENLPASHTTAAGDFSPADRRGQLLAFEGQVAKRTQVKPRVSEGAFECQRCGTMTRISMDLGQWLEPFECRGCEKKGPFWLNESQSTYIDYQKLKLENPESAASGGGTADIVAHLEGDLAGTEAIDNCQDLTLVGELQFRGDGPTPSPEIVTNAVDAPGGARDREFIAAELALFERLRDDPGSFVDGLDSPSTADVLMAAAAPKFVSGSHPRDRQVVRGIVMQLVGASTFDAADGSHYRGDIHVLLPGDPGVGKSVIAKWAAAVAPRSAMTSGERTSGPGLTAAAVKDEFSDGGFSIEPGVLVRAHRGIAVVDELDKAGEEAVEKMHSALADQILPLSLAGESMTLPTECGLLGICNPSDGHFQPGDSLINALGIASPLMSRFDLVFQMRSKQDREHIRELSETMLRTWSASLKDQSGEVLDEDERDVIDPILSMEEYRAVIARARQLDPTPASDAVIDELSDWFTRQKMALPERYGDALADDQGQYRGPPIPVTARKLGAARRVAQASARANLREEITLADVEVAKEMVSRSLSDLDIPIVYNGGLGGGAVEQQAATDLTGVS